MASAPTVSTSLRLRDKVLALDSGPRVMGVLNVTPDSFSDGGRYLQPQAAVARGLSLVEQGAHWVDVGGESTRPGAVPVHDEEQTRRVVPVIRALRDAGAVVPISIDTRSAHVAKAALEAGADAVNDVSALQNDERMIEVVRAHRAGLVLMHMQSTPEDMQVAPHYDDVVSEVRVFLEERVRFAVERGVPRECIAVDPGIGFGKTVEHNLLLLKHLGQLHESGCPILLGVSRKRFIGELLGLDDPAERVIGTVAAVAWGYLAGVQIFRVHDVTETVQALTILQAISASGQPR